MSDLLVIVPTRGRPRQCERLLESFRTHTDDADIVFVLDDDDVGTYKDVVWGDALTAVLSPRQPLSGKLNRTADATRDDYDALMFVGDDHVFGTPHWDAIMMRTLADMGGTGILYPDDKRRADVPEIWLTSTDIIKFLDWFALPELSHYYLDNAWGDLGKAAGLLRYCPEAEVAHLHYSVNPATERDALYSETESTWGQSDREAFMRWHAEALKPLVAQLRRRFSKDLAWLLERAA